MIQFAYDDLDRTTSETWYDNATPAPSITIVTDTQGGPTNEVQRVGFTGYLSGGTFTLTFDGAETSDIDYNASAATVQSALEALSTLEAGDVSVAKLQDTWDAQEWQITFQGAQAATDVSQTTIDTSNVQTGMGPPDDIQATDQEGGTFDEVQTVTLANENDGTFRLAFEGYTTAPIDHDASATDIDTALEELNSIDLVTVSGSAGGPWTVTFVGTHSDTNVSRLDGDISHLTSGTSGNVVDYTYDAANQLTSISDDDSSYDYTYDDLGRVLTVDNDGTSGVPRVILTSAYDANSNRKSLSAEIDATDDFLNTYTYDNLNRLTRLDQDGQAGGNTVVEKRVDFSYNKVGQFTKIERFNDLDGTSGDEVATAEYTYDSLGRITDLAYKNGGTNLFTPYEWTYDSLSFGAQELSLGRPDPRVAALAHGALFRAPGRVTQLVSADGTTDYTYDKTSQLTAADHTYQTDESYSYDSNGNRTMTGYTTGSNNRLTNDGTYSYAYDDEGNRTSRTNDTTEEVTEYDWDHRNRLVKVTEKDDLGDVTQVVKYKYDVFNRRISKAVDTTSPFSLADAVIQRYVYDDIHGVTSLDGGNVVLDFVDPDGTGSTAIDLERRYLYGNAVDQILAQEDDTVTETSADRVYWPLVDNLGSVRDLAKNDGTLGQHYKYDSFGNVQSGDTSVTRYLFTGREYDDDIGLQYNRARWYDGAVGRWTSEDAMGFVAGDTNSCRYVGNSPITTIDPSGMQPPLQVPYTPIFPTPVIPRYGPSNPWTPPRHTGAPLSDYYNVEYVSDYIETEYIYQWPPRLYRIGRPAGTPIEPYGPGLHINFGGEFDNPRFTDYSVENERPMWYFPNVRPIISNVEDDSVSHLIMRNAPTWSLPEVFRVLMPGGMFTYSNTPEATRRAHTEILSEYADRIALISPIQSTPVGISDPRRTDFISSGYSFSLILREREEPIISDDDERRDQE